MKTFCKLINSEGVIVYSNLEHNQEQFFEICDERNEIVKSIESKKSFRHGKIQNENGIAYLLTFDVELLQKPRYFKEKLLVLSEQLQTIELIKSDLKNDMQADNRRLIHNITTFNGRNIIELYSIVPENQVSKDFRKIKEIIKEYLLQNPDAVADSFLRIAKNSIAMKSEFTVFKKIDGDPSLLQKQSYDIRKVVLLIIHVFYHDFKENDVYVNIDDCNKKLNFDFETIRVALYHLLDNAAKYIMPNSQLRISFFEEPNNFKIELVMWSMEIRREEFDRLEIEGFSGLWAKKTGKNGDGLGIAVVKRILSLNDAELLIIPNIQNQTKRYDGINYEKNKFEINFKL